eukprot:g3869.t1
MDARSGPDLEEETAEVLQRAKQQRRTQEPESNQRRTRSRQLQQSAVDENPLSSLPARPGSEQQTSWQPRRAKLQAQTSSGTRESALRSFLTPAAGNRDEASEDPASDVAPGGGKQASAVASQSVKSGPTSGAANGARNSTFGSGRSQKMSAQGAAGSEGKKAEKQSGPGVSTQGSASAARKTTAPPQQNDDDDDLAALVRFRTESGAGVRRDDSARKGAAAQQAASLTGSVGKNHLHSAGGGRSTRGAHILKPLPEGENAIGSSTQREVQSEGSVREEDHYV